MSKIQWTEKTCNAIIGCTKVSPGCDHCYAEKMAYRLYKMGQYRYGHVTLRNKWSGHTHFVQSALDKILKRKIPTMYFMSSMGDMFHESVPWSWIEQVIAVIEECQQHTFQILTKRPENMVEYFNSLGKRFELSCCPNLWLGITAENQEMADKRIPHLLKCPAAKRFVSVEPMLSAVSLTETSVGCVLGPCDECGRTDSNPDCEACMGLPSIDWVICGGESGPGARPMHPEWARSLRDQCKAADVPFFFKQWGEWYPEKGERFGYAFDPRSPDPKPKTYGWWNDDGEFVTGDYGNDVMWRVGKKKAGCLLDCVEHKEYPK